MRCALYFGSFNPLHKGHVAIVRHVLKNCDVDSLRLVLTPMNPFKEKDSSLTDVNLRLDNLKRSVEKLNKELSKNISDNDCNCKKDNRKAPAEVMISTVEFDLPKPNYTYNTLEYLKKTEPDTTFVIIIGADNLAAIEKWYKGLEILKKYEVLVYPREGFETETLCKKYGATFLDAPQVNVSSTQIRKLESEGKDSSMLRY